MDVSYNIYGLISMSASISIHAVIYKRYYIINIASASMRSFYKARLLRHCVIVI